MMGMENVVKQSEKRRLLGMTAFKLLLGTAVFLASMGFFGLLSLNLAIKRGEKVTVPNVVNKSVVDALDILSERGIELRKSDSRNSMVIPEGFVLSQDPIPGTVVKEGTRVSVVISLGSKMAAVPDLVGKSLREARVELKGAGLKVGRFSQVHHHREMETVLAQSLPQSSQVERDTPVDLLMSLGPRPREYRLPNLIGLPLETASMILDAMGVRVGDITAKMDISQSHGIILDQDPQSGSPIREGLSVSLVMSTLYGENERIDRKFGVFLYQMPYGFWSKSVRIMITDPDGSRTIYNEVDEPGATTKVVFGYSTQCTLKVYLDDTLEMERTFR